MGLSNISHVMADFGQYAGQTLLPFSSNAGFLLAFAENPAPWGTALGPNKVPQGAQFWGLSMQRVQTTKHHCTSLMAAF